LPTIRLEVDEARRIATVTLNRPEAMNAISRQLASDLASICERLASSSDIRVAIFKGAGDRAFCAGADLKERRLLSAEDRTSHTKEIERAVESLAALPMPTIACIRGFALAGGAEIAVACDMRVAATSSVFGFPEVRIGIFPGAGGVLRLPRLVGGGAARDLLFTGRRIDAEEAYRIGLVDRLAVPDVVEDEAESIALEIAANAPLAVRAVKRALAESAGLSHEIAREQVNLLRAELDASADYEEGLTAFAERRLPRFTGR
jgi:enoyl-CoA hydratase/carnithine racemase